jgi:hypothetical protein
MSEQEVEAEGRRKEIESVEDCKVRKLLKNKVCKVRVEQ